MLHPLACRASTLLWRTVGKGEFCSHGPALRYRSRIQKGMSALLPAVASWAGDWLEARHLQGTLFEEVGL